MRQHGGMRPLDVVVLLKMALMKEPWYLKDVADPLGISRSEVSESAARSVIAGLLTADKKTVLKGPLLEFLLHGLKYVFPQMPGSVIRGVPTAHSASPLKDQIQSDDIYVWPYFKGTVLGQSIQPLYQSVPEACLKDKELYELLSLVDALRVGRAREKSLATEELEKRL